MKEQFVASPERFCIIWHMAAVGSERCPHCDGIVVSEVAVPFGETTCRSCGCPLWYLTINESLAFFRHCDAGFVSKLFSAIPEHQRLPAHMGFDSFDVLELVSEFEAALARVG